MSKYKEWKAAGEGMIVNGTPIEQADKLLLIRTIRLLSHTNKILKHEVKSERATGIALLKDFAQNVKQ